MVKCKVNEKKKSLGKRLLGDYGVLLLAVLMEETSITRMLVQAASSD